MSAEESQDLAGGGGGEDAASTVMFKAGTLPWSTPRRDIVLSALGPKHLPPWRRPHRHRSPEPEALPEMPLFEEVIEESEVAVCVRHRHDAGTGEPSTHRSVSTPSAPPPFPRARVLGCSSRAPGAAAPAAPAVVAPPPAPEPPVPPVPGRLATPAADASSFADVAAA